MAIRPKNGEICDRSEVSYSEEAETSKSTPNIDFKDVPPEMIEELIKSGRAKRETHHRNRDDIHASVSYVYTDPKTGSKRLAVFRSRSITNWWTFSSKTQWELMDTAPLTTMSVRQAFDTIHDSPLSAKYGQDAVDLMQSLPLLRTADSISQGNYGQATFNFAGDVLDVTSLGASRALNSTGSRIIKATERALDVKQSAEVVQNAVVTGDASSLGGLLLQNPKGFSFTRNPTVKNVVPDAPGPVKPPTPTPPAPRETLLPDSYWIDRQAPTQVTPGTRTVNVEKPSSSGGTYHSTTHYDEFGRQIGQTHRTHHGYSNPDSPQFHPNPHHHRRNPITGEKLKDPQTGSRTWPGLFGNDE
jgi:hypothetical protein